MEQKYREVIANLPCLNAVMAKLLALEPDGIHYFDNVDKLAHEDPSFAIRIMRLANVASRAPITPVKTLRQAIPRIGVNHIKSIISTYALADTFQCKTKSDSDLWIHSVMVAVFAKTLAPYIHDFILDEEEAYLCGLLHDIGRFISFSQLSDSLDESNWVDGQQLVISEEHVCEMEYAEIGGYACQKWQLPEFITNVVANHHLYDYVEDKQENKKLASMLRLIQLSDALSMLIMNQPEIIGLSGDTLLDALAPKCQHPSWEAKPIAVEIVAAHLSQIIEETKNILLGIESIEDVLMRDYPALFKEDDQLEQMAATDILKYGTV